jgi:peptidoglycan/xylan/chitin deacetylase (PgdA/CDA1 family)
MKALLKRLAYRGGLLGSYNRLRNRRRLTVVMFHRVLPVSDPRYAGADPEWTMTPDTFERCLKFFKKHYRIVSPRHVLDALAGARRLPGRSLLVTFDDGWADTAEYAQPLLDRHSIPALVFVVASAIGRSEPFWEERVYRLLATDPGGIERIKSGADRHGIRFAFPGGSSGMDEHRIRKVVARLGTLAAADLESIADTFAAPNPTPPAMLSNGQLSALAASSHVIGGHGMTHRPLSKVGDLKQELHRAQESLSSHLKGQPIEAMSFPHGAFSDAIVAACRSAGYKYLFSSEAVLNDVGAKLDAVRPLGRIHIPERAIVGRSGRFQPELLASWLFLRPHDACARK